MASEALLDRIADVYQQSFSRVQIAAEQAAQDAWYATDTFAGEDEEEWSALFWLIIVSAATTATGLAASYMQAQLDAEGIDVTVPDVDLEWLEDDFDVWRTSPMVAARIGISRGLDPVEAMTTAATRVTALSNAVIREAEQRAISDFRDALTISEIEVTVEDIEPDAPERPKPTKRPMFRRIPQSGACGWCRVVADRLYTERGTKNHPLGAWHDYCRCTWRKVTAKEAAQHTAQFDSGEWESVIKERATTTTGDTP